MDGGGPLRRALSGSPAGMVDAVRRGRGFVPCGRLGAGGTDRVLQGKAGHLGPARTGSTPRASHRWTATKLRWALAMDEAKKVALLNLAESCTDSVVEYEPAS
ncbi:hypothetical protein [Streptomyces sp. NPDC059611]|uniref:hypothetical protein n=1 Tax=Streptomyces sp. NPDC059611 TaxID=3346884 RepID=UPI003676BFFB